MSEHRDGNGLQRDMCVRVGCTSPCGEEWDGNGVVPSSGQHPCNRFLPSSGNTMRDGGEDGGHDVWLIGGLDDPAKEFERTQHNRWHLPRRSRVRLVLGEA